MKKHPEMQRVSEFALSLILLLFAAALQTPARAADCGTPTLGAINYVPDSSGNGTLSVTYSFPNNDPNNYLQFWIDGTARSAFNPGAQSGTYTTPFAITCWSGSHTIEILAVSCGRWGDPHYKVVATLALNVNTTPSLDSFSYTADRSGIGTLSVNYDFPNTANSSQRWLQIWIDGAQGSPINMSAQRGTFTTGLNTTCWATGQHTIEVLAVACNNWGDPLYKKLVGTTVNVDTMPRIADLTAVMDDMGTVTLSADYDFPNTASSSQRWLQLWIDGVQGSPINMQNQSGTWTTSFGTACSMSVGTHVIDLLGVACGNYGDPLYKDMKRTSIRVQHQPAVSVQLDPANPNVANVTYAFAGTNAPSQRTLRLEWQNGTPASSDIHPSQVRGVETFVLPACASQSLKAVAIACNDTRAETPIDGDARAPAVSLTLRRADLDPASQNRTVVAEVTWDMHTGTQPWYLKAEILPWTDADGTTYGTSLIWDKTPTTATGSDTFTFVPPSKAQQLVVRLTGQSCAGTAMKDVSIDCGSCAAGSSSNPVYFTDGNMRLTDFDPLPPMAGRRLNRTYNSDEQVVALFGRGWTTLFDRRLIVNPAGSEKSVSIVTENGDVVTFRGSGSAYRQSWPMARRQSASLTYDAAAATYTLRDAGSTDAAVFSATNGRLLVLRDLSSGRDAQVAYNAQGLPQSLTDSWSGVSWIITTDAQRRVVTSIAVSTRSDLVWTYIYDADRNLTSVIAPGSSTWRTYDYAGSRMTASHDAAGNLIESHTYDADGYAISSTGSIDEIASIQFNLSATATQRTTRITEKNGAVSDYVLAASGGAYRPVRIIGGCASCGMHDRTFVDDAQGRVTREQGAD